MLKQLCTMTVSLVAIAVPAFAAREATAPSALKVAYAGPNGSAPEGAVLDYATSYEPPTYSVGDVNGQDGFFAQFGNWQVTTNNPSNGVQNIDAVSDALGQTFMLSPDFLPGAEQFQIACADLAVSALGVTNDFIPQDPSVALVVTRVRLTPTGGIELLEDDGGGGAVFVDTGATYPTGTYFRACLSFDRTNTLMDFYMDGALIADDRPAIAGTSDIENIAILSLMEAGTAGTTFFNDNLTVESSTDGVVGGGPSVIEIPVLNQVGLGLLALLLLAGGAVALRRRAA